VNCDGAPTEPARIYCRAIWMADAALCESLPAQSGGLQCLAEVAAQIGLCAGIQYSRFQYQEDRFITVGWLDGQLVVLVWTPRGESRRIISMRKGNDREKALYARHLERS